MQFRTATLMTHFQVKHLKFLTQFTNEIVCKQASVISYEIFIFLKTECRVLYYPSYLPIKELSQTAFIKCVDSTLVICNIEIMPPVFVIKQ